MVALALHDRLITSVQGFAGQRSVRAQLDLTACARVAPALHPEVFAFLASGQNRIVS
jgi:hypothetical protein